jgi:type III pantothenate kinase
MNLIIDVGNTFIKLAVFKNNLLIKKINTSKEKFFEDFDRISMKYKNIINVIISSVGFFSEEAISKIKDKYPAIILSHKTHLPFINKYKTPLTLGSDRIALVSAAAIKYPSKNVLIIDVGSCITFDFKNSKNEYLGGSITPGIEFRYRSLNDYTNKLPLLKPQKTLNHMGVTTASSIHAGVIQGVIFEIDAFIDAYREKYQELTVILTGGGAQYLVESLKNDIFAHSNFLLEGLNYLVQNNKNQC